MGLLAILIIKGGEGVARALLLLRLTDGVVAAQRCSGLPLVLPLMLTLPLWLLSIPCTERLRLASRGRRRDCEAGSELIHRLADGGGVGTLIILEHDVAPCAALLIEGAHNGICVHRGVEVRKSDLVVGKSHCYCCLLLQGHQILRRGSIQFYAG